jgi:hypothetical protein
VDSRIKRHAKEFAIMKRGEKIVDPEEVLFVSSMAKFTRRSLKHFIESRMTQGSSQRDIDYLLGKVDEITRHPQLEIRNPNQRHYPGSFLVGKFYQIDGKAVIVVLDKGQLAKNIVALYFTKRSNFFKLMDRMKHEK